MFKKRIMNRIIGALLMFSMVGIAVAESVGATNINAGFNQETANTISNPVHYCDTDNGGSSDYATYSHIYFGSYPQSEVTDSATIAAIDSALLKEGKTKGDTWVGGVKYRKCDSSDCNYSRYFNENTSATYRYFKWERIRWRVLQNDGTKLFICADEGLFCDEYNENDTDVTWATSTIRSALNGYGSSVNEAGIDYSNKGFLQTAFSTAEQGEIYHTSGINGYKSYYPDSPAGVNCTDKVFLLSYDELTDTKYGFCSDRTCYSSSRWMEPTSYARAMGCYIHNHEKYTGGKDNCFWWTRSVGSSGSYADTVNYDGGIHYCDGVSNCNDAVVPALYIPLSSSLYSQIDDGGSGSGGGSGTNPGGGNGENGNRELAMKTATYQYGSKKVDILTTSHSVEQGHGAFTLICKAQKESGVTYYIDTSKGTIKSTDGIFKNLNPSDFQPGTRISIIAKDTAGNAYQTETLLKITKDDVIKGTSVSLGESTSFQLGDDVPFIGGSTAKFNVPSFPVSAVIEDGKIKIGFNIKKEMYSANSQEGVTTTTNAKRKSFKQQWTDIKSDLLKTGYIRKDYKGYLMQCDLQGGLPGVEKDVNFTFAGYAEGAWSSDSQVETVSGEFVMTISGSGTGRKQLLILSIPIVLRVEASASGSLSVKVTYDFINAKLSGDLSLLASVSLEPYVGVGVSDWLSAGVYGNGTAKVYATLLSSVTKTGLDKVTIQGKAGVKGYIAKKEVVDLVLINSKEYSVYERGNTQKMVKSSGVLSDVMNDNITEEETSWLVYNSSDADVSRVFSQQKGNDVQTVVSDVYGAATPQMASLGEVKVYGYVDETGTRKNPDQTVAKYVVYDSKTGTSTEENIIDDDNTADYKLQFISDGDELYALYLDADQEFGDKEPELSTYARSFKVSVAYFDKEKREFVEVGTYHKKDAYCYNPSLAITEEGFILSWSENDDNEILALTDTNHVYKVTCNQKGSIAGEIVTVAERTKAITSLAVDAKGNVLYFEDEDNLLTTSKQKINYYDATEDSLRVIDNCDSEEYAVGALTYQKMPNSNERALLCNCDGILAYFDEENQAIKYCDESAYIGSASGYYVCGDEIFYLGHDENGNTEESVENNGNVYKLVYNGEQYISSGVTDENGKVISFATDGESILYLAGTAEYQIADEEVFETTCDLKFLSGMDKKEIALDDVDYFYNDFTQGGSAPISAYIYNSGTKNLDGVSVTVRDEESNIVFSEEIWEPIVAGDTKKIDFVLDDTEKLSASKMHVWVSGMIKGADGNVDVTDGAVKTVDLSLTELSIEGDVRVDEEENTYVHLEAINSSAVGTTAVVSLYNEGEEKIYEEEIQIAANSVEEIDVKGLEIPEEEKLYRAAIETSDQEFYSNDNDTEIIVFALDLPKVSEVDAEKYDKVDEDSTLKPTDPTITYVTEGDVENPNPGSIIYDNETAIILQPVTRSGYKFLGWYLDENYTERITEIPAHTTASLTIYAKWGKNPMITYVMGEGAVNPVENPSTVEYDNANAITLAEATRDGYTFEGWYEDAGYARKTSVIPAHTTEDITLYAKWTEATVGPNPNPTITYVTQGDVENPNPGSITYDNETAIILQPVTRSGYKFLGWYLDENYTERITEIPAHTTASLTIYAKWGKNPTITYVIGDGAVNPVMNPSTVEYDNANAITLVAATRDGYTFDGWYEDAGYTRKTSVIPAHTTEDITLYAKWTKAAVGPNPNPGEGEDKPGHGTTDVKPQSVGTTLPLAEAGGNYKVVDADRNNPKVVFVSSADKGATTVTVPDTVKVGGVTYKVTSIADNAFKNNKTLKKVVIRGNITSIGKNAFSGCIKLSSVTIGADVTEIKDSAFQGCKELKKVVIPAAVTQIGKKAFYKCSKLKTVTIKATGLKKIGSSAFKSMKPKATIKVPKAKLKAYTKLLKKKVDKTAKIKK